MLSRFGLSLNGSPWQSTLIASGADGDTVGDSQDDVENDVVDDDDDDDDNVAARTATGGPPLTVVRTSVDRPNLSFFVRSKDGLSPEEVSVLIADDIGR